MQGMRGWPQPLPEVSYPWGAAEESWPSMLPVPLSLAQQLSDETQAQWDSGQNNQPPPPYWYPSSQAAEAEDPWDVVQVVKELFKSSAGKNKWITFCVANDVPFSQQPEEYDVAFLRRFVSFCKTDLPVAQEPVFPEVPADTWDLQTEQGRDDGPATQPTHNGLTDKIQDAVAKFLQDGMDEAESEDGDDDYINEAILSFMGQQSLVPDAPATAPPYFPKVAAPTAPPSLPPRALPTPDAPGAQREALQPPRARLRNVANPEEPSLTPPGFTLQQNGSTPTSEGAARWNNLAELTKSVNGHAQLRNVGVSSTTAPSNKIHVPAQPASSKPSKLPANGGSCQSLVETMRHLFSKGDIPYDLRIVVDDGAVNAHRYFLSCRCAVFEAKLQGGAISDPWQPMVELALPGLTVDVLKHMLLYIYTDRIDYSLEDQDSLQPQELEYCVKLCEVADSIGLTGLTKLLTDEVLLPVAETLRDFKLVQERQLIERREVQAVAAQGYSSPAAQAALNSLYPAAMPQLVSLEEQHFGAMRAWPEQQGMEQEGVDSNLQDGNDDGNNINSATIQRIVANALNTRSTTVMIRNLPRIVKQKRLLEEVDASGFLGTYDFAYLPSSFGRGIESAGLGYAFVNFEEVDSVAQFVAIWHGSRRFAMSKTDAPITVSVAECQGKEVNVRAWMRKGVRVRNPDLRPFIKGEQPWETDEVPNSTKATPTAGDNESGGSTPTAVGRNAAIPAMPIASSPLGLTPGLQPARPLDPSAQLAHLNAIAQLGNGNQATMSYSL